MRYSFIQSTMAGVALGAAVAANPALARDYHLVLPARHGGDIKALSHDIGRFITGQVGPGDSLALYDGTNNKRITKIAVPDDRRFENPKRKLRKFAPQVAQAGAFLKTLSSESTAFKDRIDVLSVLRGIGDNRTESNGDEHVLVIGQPLQLTHDRAWSMISDEGTLQIPTDAAMTSATTRTPYSVDGRETALAGVHVHICNVSASRLSRLDNLSLRHVWNVWVSAQGGSLVTWADDLAVCFERFAAKVAEPIGSARPNATLPPAMMAPVWNETERSDGAKRPQPRTFNVFFSAKHPNVVGLFVSTGIEYKPGNYPKKFNYSWCYFTSAAGPDGAQVRINVGKQQFGHEPKWGNPSDRELKSAGVSRDDVKAARSKCHFVAVGD